MHAQGCLVHAQVCTVQTHGYIMQAQCCIMHARSCILHEQKSQGAHSQALPRVFQIYDSLRYVVYLDTLVIETELTIRFGNKRRFQAETVHARWEMAPLYQRREGGFMHA